MSPLLETYDLLDYVEGRIPAPSRTVEKDGTTLTNLKYMKWLT